MKIRLTENKLKQIVAESVKNVLNEIEYTKVEVGQPELNEHKCNVNFLNENVLKQIVAKSLNEVFENFKYNIQNRFDNAKQGAKLGISGVKKNEKFSKDYPRWWEGHTDYLTKGDYHDGEYVGSQYTREDVDVPSNYFYFAGMVGASQNDVFFIIGGIKEFYEKYGSPSGYWQAREAKECYEGGCKYNNTVQEAKGVFDKIRGAVVGAVNPYRVARANGTGRHAKHEADEFIRKRSLIRNNYTRYMNCLNRITATILKNLNYVQQEAGSNFTEEVIMKFDERLRAIFNNAYRTYSKDNTNHDNVDNLVDYTK